MNNNTPDIDPTRRIAIASFMALPFAASAFAADAAGSDDELLKAREGVWRDWFAGHRAALMAILPPEFVGIGAGGAPFRSRTETIADAEAFAATGGKLTALTFTDNRIQKFGDVRVIFCGFSFTTTARDGVTNTITGRATEVFVRSGNRWLHPGWHLDSGK